jgi:hypothetical protein
MVMMNYLKEEVANLLHLDWAALNLAKSTVGIAIVLVALILFSTIGAFGFTVAFGAALAVTVAGGGPRRQRVTALVGFALAGALATLLGNGSGQSVWGSVAVVFGITLVCGLALALGPQVGKMAFLINLWMIITVSLSPILYDPLNLALGFLCGSGTVALLLLLLPKTDETEADSPLSWSFAPLRAHLSLHSPIMQFALSRSLIAAFAMWLGWWLRLAHPYWIALTLLIVMVPDRRLATHTSWARGLGTVLGVAIGAVVLGFNLSPITLLLMWLLVTLVMLAVQSVSYTLYATILTLDLILFYQLLEADVLFNGVERLVATLLGIIFALGIIGLLEILAKRSIDKKGFLS